MNKGYEIDKADQDLINQQEQEEEEEEDEEDMPRWQRRQLEEEREKKKQMKLASLKNNQIQENEQSGSKDRNQLKNGFNNFILKKTSSNDVESTNLEEQIKKMKKVDYFHKQTSLNFDIIGQNKQMIHAENSNNYYSDPDEKENKGRMEKESSDQQTQILNGLHLNEENQAQKLESNQFFPPPNLQVGIEDSIKQALNSKKNLIDINFKLVEGDDDDLDLNFLTRTKSKSQPPPTPISFLHKYVKGVLEQEGFQIEDSDDIKVQLLREQQEMVSQASKDYQSSQPSVHETLSDDEEDEKEEESQKIKGKQQKNNKQQQKNKKRQSLQTLVHKKNDGNTLKINHCQVHDGEDEDELSGGGGGSSTRKRVGLRMSLGWGKIDEIGKGFKSDSDEESNRNSKAKESVGMKDIHQKKFGTQNTLDQGEIINLKQNQDSSESNKSTSRQIKQKKDENQDDEKEEDQEDDLEGEGSCFQGKNSEFSDKMSSGKSTTKSQYNKQHYLKKDKFEEFCDEEDEDGDDDCEEDENNDEDEDEDEKADVLHEQNDDENNQNYESKKNPFQNYYKKKFNNEKTECEVIEEMESSLESINQSSFKKAKLTPCQMNLENPSSFFHYFYMRESKKYQDMSESGLSSLDPVLEQDSYKSDDLKNLELRFNSSIHIDQKNTNPNDLECFKEILSLSSSGNKEQHIPKLEESEEYDPEKSNTNSKEAKYQEENFSAINDNILNLKPPPLLPQKSAHVQENLDNFQNFNNSTSSSSWKTVNSSTNTSTIPNNGMMFNICNNEAISNLQNNINYNSTSLFSNNPQLQQSSSPMSSSYQKDQKQIIEKPNNCGHLTASISIDQIKTPQSAPVFLSSTTNPSFQSSHLSPYIRSLLSNFINKQVDKEVKQESKQDEKSENKINNNNNSNKEFSNSQNGSLFNEKISFDSIRSNNNELISSSLSTLQTLNQKESLPLNNVESILSNFSSIIPEKFSNCMPSISINERTKNQEQQKMKSPPNANQQKVSPIDFTSFLIPNLSFEISSPSIKKDLLNNENNTNKLQFSDNSPISQISQSPIQTSQEISGSLLNVTHSPLKQDWNQNYSPATNNLGSPLFHSTPLDIIQSPYLNKLQGEKTNNINSFMNKSEQIPKINTNKGDVVHSKRQGYGSLINLDGSVFSGSFKNDKKNGFGKMLASSGDLIYSGEYKNDLYDGQGNHYNIIKSNNEKVLDPSDLTQIDEYWISYSGEFKEGKRHGYGQLKFASQQHYEGQFSNGIINGYGVFSEKENGQKINGNWIEGILKKSE